MSAGDAAVRRNGWELVAPIEDTEREIEALAAGSAVSDAPTDAFEQWLRAHARPRPPVT